MHKLNQPYIRLDLDPTHFEKISRVLKRNLLDMGIPSENPAFPPHISVGYVLETLARDYTEDVINCITSGKLDMKIVGIECLPGLTTDFDYITLAVGGDSEVFYASEYVAECCEVKKFKGGFSLHITVLRIPKGLSEQELHDLGRFLEIHFSNLYTDKFIIPASLTVCNKDAVNEFILPIAA